MSAHETFDICETCRERVEPSDPDVLYAVELKEVGGFGTGREYAEGLGVYFHEWCYPEGSRLYRRKPKPG